MANKRKEHPTNSDDDDDEDDIVDYQKLCINEEINKIHWAISSGDKELQEWQNMLIDLPGMIQEGVERKEKWEAEIIGLIKKRDSIKRRKLSPPAEIKTNEEVDFKLWIHFSSDPSKQQEAPYRLSLTGPVGVFADDMWGGRQDKIKPQNLDYWYDSVRMIECPAKDRIWLTASRSEWIPKVLNYLDGEVVFLPKPIAGLIVEYWDAKPAARLARIQPESIGICGPVMELEVYDDEDGRLLASNQEDSPDAIFVEYNPRLLIDISADYPPPVQYYRPVIQI